MGNRIVDGRSVVPMSALAMVFALLPLGSCTPSETHTKDTGMGVGQSEEPGQESDAMPVYDHDDIPWELASGPVPADAVEVRAKMTETDGPALFHTHSFASVVWTSWEVVRGKLPRHEAAKSFRVKFWVLAESIPFEEKANVGRIATFRFLPNGQMVDVVEEW